jgi:hypothetical protein
MLALTTVSRAQIFFQKTYGSTATADYGHSVVEAPDSSFFVAGVRVSGTFPNIIGEGLLLRTDKYGNEIWTNYFSTPGSTDLTFDHIQHTSDGNLIVTGVANYGAGNYDAYLCKMDTSGNLIWYKTYGDNCRQRAMQVKETFDGGFILGGWNETMCNATSSVFLVKTNSQGDSLWSNAYFTGDQQYGYAVAQTPDSGYVLTGSIDLPLLIGASPYVVKTDKNGDTLWTRVLSTLYSGHVRDVVISDSGTIMVTGWLAPGGCARPILAEYDMNGNQLWVQNYSTGLFCEWSYAMYKTNDGGYAVFGMDGASDFYLVKTNNALNMQWSQKYHQGDADYGYSVQQTMDGGYVMAGLTNTGGNTDILLIKTDSLGNAVGINETPKNVSVLVYPNPAANSFTIQSVNQNLITWVDLYTLEGKCLTSKNFRALETTLDVAGFSTGMYFLRITTEKGIIIKRVEIMR